jgi:excisionase family DNA binding protein
MNGATQRIIRAALAADETVTKDQVEASLAVLNGRLPQQGPLPLLLTQKQTAFLLGVSRFTVNRMVKEGELHPIKIRDAVRYRRTEVEEIASGKTLLQCLG